MHKYVLLQFLNILKFSRQADITIEFLGKSWSRLTYITHLIIVLSSVSNPLLRSTKLCINHQSLSQLKDPPEIGDKIRAVATPNVSFVPHPNVSSLPLDNSFIDNFPQTKELSGMTKDAYTSVAEDLAVHLGPVKNSKNKRNRMCYVNQGIRAKSLFSSLLTSTIQGA